AVAVAQSSTIKGHVTDTTANEPALVDIQLEGPTRMYSSTDVDGNFNITNLLPGTYTLTCSSLGYETEVRKIIVNSGESKTIAINIGATKAEVEGVVVLGSRVSNTQTA